MQTIENSLIAISIDEKTGWITNYVLKSAELDYLKTDRGQEQLTIVFPELAQAVANLPWTIIDKGDTRLSLALIDNEDSYQRFAYHFELILSFAIESNQLQISLYLKNSSPKQMPFSAEITVPGSWTAEAGPNTLSLTHEGAGQKTNLQLSSDDFSLTNDQGKAKARIASAPVPVNSDQTYGLKLIPGQ